MLQLWQVWSLANDCWHNKEGGKKIKKENEEDNIAHDIGYDSEIFVIMATTCERSSMCEKWYLDFGCSNHMQGAMDD